MRQNNAAAEVKVSVTLALYGLLTSKLSRLIILNGRIGWIVGPVVAPFVWVCTPPGKLQKNGIVLEKPHPEVCAAGQARR